MYEVINAVLLEYVLNISDLQKNFLFYYADDRNILSENNYNIILFGIGLILWDKLHCHTFKRNGD